MADASTNGERSFSKSQENENERKGTGFEDGVVGHIEDVVDPVSLEETVVDQGTKQSAVEQEEVEEEQPKVSHRRRRHSGSSTEDEEVADKSPSGTHEVPGRSEVSSEDDDADSWEEREPSVGAEQDENESEEEEDNIPKESPMFVPRSGRYFLHDDRQLEEEDEKNEEKESEAKAIPSRSEAVNRWEHDMYIAEEQAPRTPQEKERDRRFYENLRQRDEQRVGGGGGDRGRRGVALGSYFPGRQQFNRRMEQGKDTEEQKASRGDSGRRDYGYADRGRKDYNNGSRGRRHYDNGGRGRRDYNEGDRDERKYNQGGRERREYNRRRRDYRESGSGRRYDNEGGREERKHNEGGRERRGGQGRRDHREEMNEGRSAEETSESWENEASSSGRDDSVAASLPSSTNRSEDRSISPAADSQPEVAPSSSQRSVANQPKAQQSLFRSNNTASMPSRVFTLNKDSGLVVKEVRPGVRSTQVKGRGRGRGRGLPVRPGMPSRVPGRPVVSSEVKVITPLSERATVPQPSPDTPPPPPSPPAAVPSTVDEDSPASSSPPKSSILGTPPPPDASKPKRYSSQRLKGGEGGKEEENATVPDAYQLPMAPPIAWAVPQMMPSYDPVYQHALMANMMQNPMMMQMMYQQQLQLAGGYMHPPPHPHAPIHPLAPSDEHFINHSAEPPTAYHQTTTDSQDVTKNHPVAPPPGGPDSQPSASFNHSSGLFIPGIDPEQQRMLHAQRQGLIDPAQKRNQAIPIIQPKEN